MRIPRREETSWLHTLQGRLRLRRGATRVSGEPAVQAYCHCESCRTWLGAPVHAATLWPTPNVKIVKGADNLGLYKRTENSHRQFCKSCGSPVLVGHPTMGLTDLPSVSVRDSIPADRARELRREGHVRP